MLAKVCADRNSELLGIIESLRKEMIKVGLKEGLSSEKTIEISQRLDRYIAHYQSKSYQIEA
ncbi:aspartyl-phosphate phosphatase Spo0E family protein [Neobacillus sp. LXY-4]|uniref:aspartyl-phosphate phosphatase Spo0E family protein n=1 Tax=Neobacillus sp. LXY-4 TaxID=3379826 RepID=UPI003EE22B35